ncbi:MAG: alpha/beta fold hydrolase [Rhodospirillaceae bacterium]|nr:alpha/beta fold hydrolase [Rhodospirillaceae bacterium]
MTIEITRHFATVKGERQVHYRRAGSGPPVILLHQSPTSSREYIPLIREIAGLGFTVFSPDTPGNGLSDPVPGDEWNPMEGFADGVVNLMDELGIKKAPVYGFHTGGVCALALGLRHPERFTVCIMNGYIQMDKAEVDEILANYLPEMELNWSGSHLTWAWARFREQLIFFPWYRKDVARRMNYDVPPPAHIHTALMDFMKCQDYRRAYRPAFLFDCAAAVKNTKANMVITTAKSDVLDKYHQMLTAVPANVKLLNPANPDESKAQFVKIIADNPAPGPAPAIVKTKPMPGKIWQEYAQVDGGSIYARRNTDGNGRPIVFIHASAASSHSMDGFMKPFIGKRPVIAFDLPGNGESDNPMGATVTVEAQAKYLAQAIAGVGYNEVDVFGYWGGCAVAVELAVQNPTLVKHVAAPSLMVLDDVTRDEYLANYTPTIEFEEFGAHWIKVWNMVRDQELFSHWYKRKKDHIIRSHEPNIAPAVLHRRTVDLFKALDIYQSAYGAHFSYPVLAKLPKVTCPVLLNDTMPGTRQALTASKTASAKPLPGAPEALAAQLLEFFG